MGIPKRHLNVKIKYIPALAVRPVQVPVPVPAALHQVPVLVLAALHQVPVSVPVVPVLAAPVVESVPVLIEAAIKNKK